MTQYLQFLNHLQALSDDMDDIKSRHECETIILDRKIESLVNLREKWRETENNLRDLSSTLQKYEVNLSTLDSVADLAEITKLEGDIRGLDVRLVTCEESVISLEQHIDGATRLTARVANIRSRYETLRQRSGFSIKY